MKGWRASRISGSGVQRRQAAASPAQLECRSQSKMASRDRKSPLKEGVVRGNFDLFRIARMTAAQGQHRLHQVQR
jgi:hypothetical protein